MAIRKLGAFYDAIPQKSKQNHGMIAVFLCKDQIFHNSFISF